MGCGSSSDSGNPDEIQTYMKPTLIQSYDDLFAKISEVLEKLESLRGGLQDNEDDMNELANTDSLKGGNLVDAVNAWLWAVSASCGGEIAKADLSVTEQSPYISWSLGNSYVDCWSFQEKLKAYFQTCIDGPKTIKELASSLEELINQAKELSKTCKEDATSANLNMGQALKAGINTASNLKTAVNGLQKLNKVKEAIEKGVSNIKELVPKFPSMILEADKNGSKAHKDGNLVPSACIKYNEKEKKNAADNEKAKKEREKKKKAKKDKKDKKEKKDVAANGG